MDELVRWLGEQLDEDERIARATHPKFLTWDYDDCVMQVRDLGNGNELANVLPRHEYGVHIAAHDPARVLREIEADRALLRQYAEVAANDVDDVEYAHGWANALGLAVRLRASAFSDRPGFRPEWAPDLR